MCEAVHCRRYDAEYLAEYFRNLLTDLNRNNVLTVLRDFDLDLPLNSTYCRQYMSMVSTLLQFIRAEREGKWDIHMSAFVAMVLCI